VIDLASASFLFSSTASCFIKLYLDAAASIIFPSPANDRIPEHVTFKIDRVKLVKNVSLNVSL
jgi:hypothetical protein